MPVDASVCRSDQLGSDCTAQSFPRTARLLKRADFDHVFRNRTDSVRVRGILCLIAAGQTDHARIGFAISKKNLSRAVARNRLKRLLREQFRVLQQDLPACDLVVLSQREISSIPRDQWSELCSQLFVRIIARSRPQT